MVHCYLPITHYLGKININSKEHYVRFTVQEVKVNPSKKKAEGFTPNELHYTFITDIAVYENTAKSPIKAPSTYLAMGTNSSILDAKLQQFFERLAIILSKSG